MLAWVSASAFLGLSARPAWAPVIDDAPFVPLSPARLLETREGPGLTTVDGQFQGIGLRAAGSTLELTVAGRGGVADNALAVVLNVTVTSPAQSGYITVFPCGSSRPLASNLNFAAGQTVANAVAAKVGAVGKVCLYAAGATQLVADVNGYFPAASTFVPLTPARLLETRQGQGMTTVDGQFQGLGIRAEGSTLELNVAGRGGAADNALAVVLNVTVTGPVQGGYITVFPCGSSRPLASNLNYGAGQTVANMVVAKVGAVGKVCLFAAGSTHLVADVNGFFPAGSTTFTPLSPARLLETRERGDLTTVDGQSRASGLDRPHRRSS